MKETEHDTCPLCHGVGALGDGICPILNIESKAHEMTAGEFFDAIKAVLYDDD